MKKQIILTIGIVLSMLAPLMAYAQSAVDPHLSIPRQQPAAQSQNQPAQPNPTFGDFETTFFGNDTIDATASNGLVSIVGTIVTFVTAAIVVGGIIAIVIAGYMYMTAGGSSERVGTAKSIIGGALLGIALALAAVVILNTINPKLGSQAENPTIETPSPVFYHPPTEKN